MTQRGSMEIAIVTFDPDSDAGSKVVWFEEIKWEPAQNVRKWFHRFIVLLLMFFIEPFWKVRLRRVITPRVRDV